MNNFITMMPSSEGYLLEFKYDNKNIFLNCAYLLQYLTSVYENMNYEAKNMVTIVNNCEVEGRLSIITPLFYIYCHKIYL